MDRFNNYSNFYPLLYAACQQNGGAYQQNGGSDILTPQFTFESPPTSSSHLISVPSGSHQLSMISSGSPISEPTTYYMPDTSVHQPSSPSIHSTKHTPLKRKRRARAPEGENRACTICGEIASGCVSR